MTKPFKRLAGTALNRLKSFSFNADIRANRLQLLSGRLTDADFDLFEFIDGPGGLVIDVGANRGHCALAVLERTRHLELIAFEPIAALEKPLRWIERQYPGRFSYHRCALGAASDLAELIIPTAGELRATTNASLRRSEFSKDYVQARLAGELGTDFGSIQFPAEAVEVRTLDSFGLEPLAIKIDVEGLEKDVIEGGRETISLCKPMLIIEMNNHMEFFPVLEALGYRFYRYDPMGRRLVAIDDSMVHLNVVCLHPDRRVLPAGMVDGLKN